VIPATSAGRIDAGDAGPFDSVTGSSGSPPVRVANLS